MMQTLDPRAACRSRLRFVYDDAVVSLRLGSAPTFGDVASAMARLAVSRHAMPRAIDFRLGAPSPARSAAMGI